MMLLAADVSAMGLVPEAVVVNQTVEMLSEEVDTGEANGVGELVTKGVVSDNVVTAGGRKVEMLVLVLVLLGGGGGTEAIV